MRSDREAADTATDVEDGGSTGAPADLPSGACPPPPSGSPEPEHVTCPTCGGSGWFPLVPILRQPTPCGRCGGEGRLRVWFRGGKRYVVSGETRHPRDGETFLGGTTGDRGDGFVVTDSRCSAGPGEECNTSGPILVPAPAPEGAAEGEQEAAFPYEVTVWVDLASEDDAEPLFDAIADFAHAYGERIGRDVVCSGQRAPDPTSPGREDRSSSEGAWHVFATEANSVTTTTGPRAICGYCEEPVTDLPYAIGLDGTHYHGRCWDGMDDETPPAAPAAPPERPDWWPGDTVVKAWLEQDPNKPRTNTGWFAACTLARQVGALQEALRWALLNGNGPTEEALSPEARWALHTTLNTQEDTST